MHILNLFLKEFKYKIMKNLLACLFQKYFLKRKSVVIF